MDPDSSLYGELSIINETPHLILPQWLDNLIFNELGAKYCRSNSDMTVIDWDRNDILNYLGTYFPRSYTESYCIFCNYFTKNQLEWNNKTSISLFDFGCGTGGEIIGAITAIINKNPNIEHINISALDGNYHALRLLENILKQYCTKTSINITYKTIPLVIEDLYDLSILDSVFSSKFDIVLSFKAICEFVSKQRFEQNNAYTYLANFFQPKINENGILLIADVTSYNNISQEWLPNMMDNGLKEAECNIIAKNSGYNQTFFVSHSKKQKDISKIAWRLIQNNK